MIWEWAIRHWPARLGQPPEVDSGRSSVIRWYSRNRLRRIRAVEAMTPTALARVAFHLRAYGDFPPGHQWHPVRPEHHGRRPLRARLLTRGLKP